LLEAGLKRHQQLGDQQGQALIYVLLAQAAASEHDYTAAQNLAIQSLEIARTVHDSRSLILCLEEDQRTCSREQEKKGIQSFIVRRRANYKGREKQTLVCYCAWSNKRFCQRSSTIFDVSHETLA
jgi:hypothetical protein